MKRPPFPPEDDASGRVVYDDRGNAVWQWKDEDTLNQKLAHPRLELDEDPPPPAGSLAANPLAAKTGYNPYGSGVIDKDRPRKPKDLRALSEWIALKKKRGEDFKR
jgi:hypothetical protein